MRTYHIHTYRYNYSMRLVKFRTFKQFSTKTRKCPKLSKILNIQFLENILQLNVACIGNNTKNNIVMVLWLILCNYNDNMNTTSSVCSTPRTHSLISVLFFLLFVVGMFKKSRNCFISASYIFFIITIQTTVNLLLFCLLFNFSIWKTNFFGILLLVFIWRKKKCKFVMFF